MSNIHITIGDERFEARFLHEKAPETCVTFRTLLPYSQKLIHVRWSGEACWIPLGGLDLKLGFESATSYPQPGEILLYPGGVSETEILIAYGPVRFASRFGQLTGTPFLRISDRLEVLAEIGRTILWGGHKQITFGGCDAPS